MTQDPKRTAEIMRAVATCIEVVGPFDPGERLQILVGALMMLESPLKARAEKMVAELMKRAGG